MTNEEQASATPGTPSSAAVDETRFTDVVESTLDRFLSTADQARAIGDPITHGDRMIIPTAEVTAVLGFGVGGGGSQGSQQTPSGFGTGGGGGGNAFSRPVAVIVAGPDGVEVTPVIDITKIALTALTAFGFMLATLGRFRRRPQA